MMRVLIGFEESGVVRRAFRSLGYDAWSCDLIPSRDGSPYHLQGDIFDYTGDSWDMAVMHPPCDYLTVSAAWAYGDGPYHQKVKPDTPVGEDRRILRSESVALVAKLLALPYPVAVENPSPSFLSSRLRKPDQVIQPHEFGEDASKGTGLWLKDLPLLQPTGGYPPRITASGKKRWGNQTDSGQNNLGPSENRKRDRSETYPGIADAMADQWGLTIECRGMLA